MGVRGPAIGVWGAVAVGVTGMAGVWGTVPVGVRGTDGMGVLDATGALWSIGLNSASASLEALGFRLLSSSKMLANIFSGSSGVFSNNVGGLAPVTFDPGVVETGAAFVLGNR